MRTAEFHQVTRSYNLIFHSLHYFNGLFNTQLTYNYHTILYFNCHLTNSRTGKRLTNIHTSICWLEKYFISAAGRTIFLISGCRLVFLSIQSKPKKQTLNFLLPATSHKIHNNQDNNSTKLQFKHRSDK